MFKILVLLREEKTRSQKTRNMCVGSCCVFQHISVNMCAILFRISLKITLI